MQKCPVWGIQTVWRLWYNCWFELLAYTIKSVGGLYITKIIPIIVWHPRVDSYYYSFNFHGFECMAIVRCYIYLNFCVKHEYLRCLFFGIWYSGNTYFSGQYKITISLSTPQSWEAAAGPNLLLQGDEQILFYKFIDLSGDAFCRRSGFKEIFYALFSHIFGGRWKAWAASMHVVLHKPNERW